MYFNGLKIFFDFVYFTPFFFIIYIFVKLKSSIKYYSKDIFKLNGSVKLTVLSTKERYTQLKLWLNEFAFYKYKRFNTNLKLKLNNIGKDSKLAGKPEPSLSLVITSSISY